MVQSPADTIAAAELVVVLVLVLDDLLLHCRFIRNKRSEV